VLLTGAGVIGNSQVTLDALSDFGRAERLPSVPSVAAWLGIDPISSRVSARAPDRPTFVTIGTIEGRKNHLLLLKVWSRLIDRLGSQAPQLLIIGQRGWEVEPVFKLLDNSEQLRGHVIEINRCSDDELAQHLITARALLFPSFVEGYGLPLIEAFGRGVPVIASDLPVFREIASDIPSYLSPSDEPGWEAAILDYSTPESAARAAQVDRIRSFRQPEWNRHFDIVERWLRRLR
jgi:glycosyltransferase involved in cell wall biosynthesis